jgi:hypothetical protein
MWRLALLRIAVVILNNRCRLRSTVTMRARARTRYKLFDYIINVNLFS